MLDVVVLLTITSNLSSLIHQRKINNNYFGKSPEMMNGNKQCCGRIEIIDRRVHYVSKEICQLKLVYGASKWKHNISRIYKF
jgi:hypothetical protein